MSLRVTVVGIGADGWDGLTRAAQQAILAADEVFGSERQLATLPPSAPPRHAWPTPLLPALEEILARASGSLCIIASGDPMLHGIGATVARIAPQQLSVIPHVSAFALACARLRWPEAEVELVSHVFTPVEAIARVLAPDRRIVAYGSGRDHAARLARTLVDRGYGGSRFVVMERLGAADERLHHAVANDWGERLADPLHAVAVVCAPDPGTAAVPAVPGLPDEVFEHDGALTKRHVRAATLAALAPLPGAHLWDIGAGSGSIAIEWLRAAPHSSAVAIEARRDRAQRIERNARTLGVPQLVVVTGEAPLALDGLKRPDAIFIGGGLTSGVLETAHTALRPGGRLVVNAVTLEGEQLLVDAHTRLGGELVKLAVSHAQPLGGYTAWRPALPVVQWAVVKA